jgi:predicted nucleic acid-binding protein
MIIVDTNVLSELMRPSPSSAVRDWVRSQAEDQLYTTAITVAEIRYGIGRLAPGQRKDSLRAAADEIFAAFDEQVLPFDLAAAMHYPQIVNGRDRLGLPMDGFDAQIASVCQVHDARLATRNLKDFRETGIDVIDPWQHLG